ncbi:MAG TPA: signal peptidase II [Anaerolineae bacterium]|nr:signal peptidase II [Anaerolineae bacterium]
MLRRSTVAILLIALLLITLDQVSKYLVSTLLPINGTWSPFPGEDPFFRIIYVYNTGAAFGSFRDLGIVFIPIAFLVIAGILYYSRRVSDNQKLLRVALGFMLGGASGNLIDRLLRSGHVIDFLDVGVGSTRWYVSNFADISIVLGVILLGVSMWRDEKKQQPAAVPAPISTDSNPPE